jgi:hypothetical protein
VCSARLKSSVSKVFLFDNFQNDLQNEIWSKQLASFSACHLMLLTLVELLKQGIPCPQPNVGSISLVTLHATSTLAHYGNDVIILATNDYKGPARETRNIVMAITNSLKIPKFSHQKPDETTRIMCPIHQQPRAIPILRRQWRQWHVARLAWNQESL